MAFIKLVLLIILITLTLCGDSQGGRGRGMSSIGKRFGKSSHRRSYSMNRNGISRSRLGILFPTTMALAGIYIGSRMQSHVHIRSYRDLDGYTVCDGRPMMPGGSLSLTYSYFLCPDNPNQPFERYCCKDDSGHGLCCSYDMKRNVYLENGGGIFGGIFGVLIFAGVIATIAYCCCCRNRRQVGRKQTSRALFLTSAHAHGVPGTGASVPIDTADQPPIPVNPSIASPPYPLYPQPQDATSLPYPSAYTPPPYPAAVLDSTTVASTVSKPSAIGSGWGDPRFPAVAPASAPPDDPPPYYSVAGGSKSPPYPMP